MQGAIIKLHLLLFGGTTSSFQGDGDLINDHFLLYWGWILDNSISGIGDSELI